MNMCSGNLVLPSDKIDHVWHIHLCHNDAYIEIIKFLMGDSRKFDNEPTTGGDEQCNKVNVERYENTLLFYEFLFGQKAP